jgi:hypothetical protein
MNFTLVKTNLKLSQQKLSGGKILIMYYKNLNKKAFTRVHPNVRVRKQWTTF